MAIPRIATTAAAVRSVWTAHASIERIENGMNNVLLAKIIRPKLIEIDDTNLSKSDKAAISALIRWCSKTIREADAA